MAVGMTIQYLNLTSFSGIWCHGTG